MASKNKKPYQMTPEQIALSEARKAKKLEAAANQQSAVPDSLASEEGKILARPWIHVSSHHAQSEGDRPLRVLTWNLLAQCLVRRELFPTSNCLKAGQREQMLFRELLDPQADILCLQEVDRLEKLLPALEKAGYSSHYAAGPRKKHGCLISFKTDCFAMVSSRKIEYDFQSVRTEGTELQQYGRSFTTKNIGSLVALQSRRSEGEAFIVATTHLFWHPKYTYERTRQAGLLLREVLNFRSELQLEHAPCIIAGDFNFAPDDPAYSLLVGDNLSSEQVQALLPSYVVHTSVDPSIPRTPASANDGEDEAVDPDRVITSARPAKESDGLLSVEELVDLFSKLPTLRSTYDIGLSTVAKGNNIRTFGDRVDISLNRRGRCEPEYTSYTHYWKTTLGIAELPDLSYGLADMKLDYIFILDPTQKQSSVEWLLAPPKKEEMGFGLPQKGVTSSDHVSLAADLVWQAR